LSAGRELAPALAEFAFFWRQVGFASPAAGIDRIDEQRRLEQADWLSSGVTSVSPSPRCARIQALAAWSTFSLCASGEIV
jgi:hypothetical protein